MIEEAAMRNQFQKLMRLFPIALFAMAAGWHSYQAMVPSALAVEGGNQALLKSNVPEDLKNVDAQVQKIISEMTFEQERHQEKVEAIKKELRAIVKTQGPQNNNWVPDKIAMVLDQESK